MRLAVRPLRVARFLGGSAAAKWKNGCIRATVSLSFTTTYRKTWQFRAEGAMRTSSIRFCRSVSGTGIYLKRRNVRHSAQYFENNEFIATSLYKQIRGCYLAAIASITQSPPPGRVLAAKQLLAGLLTKCFP